MILRTRFRSNFFEISPFAISPFDESTILVIYKAEFIMEACNNNQEASVQGTSSGHGLHAVVLQCLQGLVPGPVGYQKPQMLKSFL